VLKELSDSHFPGSEKIVLVQDNLNTHKPASLYEAFPPADARRLVERFECITRPNMEVGWTWPNLNWVSCRPNVSTDHPGVRVVWNELRRYATHKGERLTCERSSPAMSGSNSPQHRCNWRRPWRRRRSAPPGSRRSCRQSDRPSGRHSRGTSARRRDGPWRIVGDSRPSHAR